jgi:hypothetical protein
MGTEEAMRNLFAIVGLAAIAAGCADSSIDSSTDSAARSIAAESKEAGVVLIVRLTSDLPFDELERRLMVRKPSFMDVPGLIQKIYGHDPATGAACGIYFFESREALAAFRDSDLARTIAEAYEATDVRREAFEVLYPLRAGVVPW